MCLSIAAVSLPAFANSESQKAPARTTVAACHFGLGFFSYERGCIVSWSQNEIIDYGIRFHQSEYTEVISDILGVIAVHPFSGTFYFEGGVGASYRKAVVKNDTLFKEGFGFAYSFKLGNRWTLPFGMTLGLNYLGIQTSSFLLIAPEIGWSF